MGSLVASGCRPAHFLLLALVALAAGAGKASAATFLVLNLCPFPVWPAAVPTGAGTGPLTKLEHAKAWFVRVPSGTGRIWGRTGCDFAGDGEHGGCSTGDCAGALHCQSMGKPPATVAEFTISDVAGIANDTFGISVADGFNLPLDFACGGGNPRVWKEWVRCREPGCPDAMKVHSCRSEGDYNVVFCPFKD
ncbi:thaumatin-like protein [Sorghum bicolor]|uniref:Thaumatin-like protein n=1 Tax=Sorghum bicolor TaxID=4558 RepID=A0A1Z5R7F8_SORBI|nr:thaumatin-like protein [Sorghum bicolor]OQU79698.1 hypothetical protein SORBI_3008G181701 [Sorghum bicolor]|eukprot:XP_021321583.1 thaumatin-like protein [Sorghum bicolor]